MVQGKSQKGMAQYGKYEDESEPKMLIWLKAKVIN